MCSAPLLGTDTPVVFVQNGMPVEVEAILLAPLTFAEAAGASVPTLSAVAALVSWRAAQ